MKYRKLHLLPISVFVLIPTTFVITYTCAVLLGHVEPGFPYISDTGALPPESCVFSQLLGIASVLYALLYRQAVTIEPETSGSVARNQDH
ncbi:unnamed protein product [Timema podura]|uniref:CWH43-like N-terminal domain-containing protein n=1 Tax=Timema podura TaxID=61482 RepID=A0ABN7NLP0_TIMPD|nr:unnamed protein product [Timema podura]